MLLLSKIVFFKRLKDLLEQLLCSSCRAAAQSSQSDRFDGLAATAAHLASPSPRLCPTRWASGPCLHPSQLCPHLSTCATCASVTKEYCSGWKIVGLKGGKGKEGRRVDSGGGGVGGVS